jgi:hypothetical protein
MREFEFPLAADSDCQKIERAIDRAIAGGGLRVTLRGSLAKFPGCVHWHVKKGREPGTLEITLWPREHRAWFTIQDGRKADWIEGELRRLHDALNDQIRGFRRVRDGAGHHPEQRGAG